MKSAKDWLAERPLASENQERWVQCIMDASRLNLTQDDIRTLTLLRDDLRGALDREDERRLELCEKILRQCEGQKFEGE